MWIISFFFALILVALLQVWLFSRFSFRRLSYRRQFMPSVVNEGDTVTMIETIRNEKLLPLPWIRIEAGISSNLLFGGQSVTRGSAQTDSQSAVPDSSALALQNTVQSGARQYHRSIFSLGPYSTVTRRHKVTCPRRGYYHIRSVAVTAGDLLGLGKNRSREIETDSLVVVYPTIIPIDDILNNKNSFTGDIVVRRWIVDDPFMIRGVRDYTGSEPYNRINWKATAKTGELQVHDFDYTSDIRLLILVNIDTSAEQWGAVTDEARAERALSHAASVAQYAIENGVETGFATNARVLGDAETIVYAEPRSGATQITEIFDTTAKLTLNRVVSFGSLLQNIAARGLSNLDFLLITAYTDELIDRQIDAIRMAGNYVEILSPDAAARPVSGEVAQ